MDNLTYVPVEKEQIPTLKFGNQDVLTDELDRKKRMHDVSRATVLGNGYHGKVEIFFQTADGELKRVNTTIWDCDPEHLILKSDACIPTRSVFGIDFF
jgi:hypothetical protein